MSVRMNRRNMLRSVGMGAVALSVGCRGGGAVLAQSATKSSPSPKAYALPPLPYGYDALRPGIEEDVLRVHHDKHHAGYVRGLNATLKALDQARASAGFSAIKRLSRNLAFHGSGHVLHALYWESMKPGGSPEPTGTLGRTMARDFGSFARFRGQFLAAAKKVEGSGWAVLAHEPLGRRLVVLQAEKHQNFSIWGVTPLMVCDVWEHAYYVQYQNRRGDYADNFFKLVDWPGVARRYAGARR